MSGPAKGISQDSSAIGEKLTTPRSTHGRSWSTSSSRLLILLAVSTVSVLVATVIIWDSRRGTAQVAIPFTELCDRVRTIVREQFGPAGEPDTWLYDEDDLDREREAQPAHKLLEEILQCKQPLVDAIEQALPEELHPSGYPPKGK